MTRSSLLDSPGNSALSDPPFVANADRDVLQAVGADVAVPNQQAVECYLADHAALQALLPLICERVRAEFGGDAELSLELYRDPEVEDRYLTLYVRQDQYEANIVERLDQLSEQFADELDRCTGDLLLTADLSPRRSQHGVRLEAVPRLGSRAFAANNEQCGHTRSAVTIGGLRELSDSLRRKERPSDKFTCHTIVLDFQPTQYDAAWGKT